MTKEPSMKMPDSMIFCDRRICRRQVEGIGMIMRMTSVTMVGTALPMKNLSLLRQVPVGRVRSHAFFTGVHWKMVAKIW